MAGQVQRLAALVAKLGGPLPALDRTVEEAVAALALEVARCVIGDEVARSHAFLVSLIREAIAKVPLEMGSPRVLLNPADLELVRNLAPEIESTPRRSSPTRRSSSAAASSSPMARTGRSRTGAGTRAPPTGCRRST